MAVYSGPEIVKDGLVLHLDMASNKSYPSQGLEVEYLIVAGGGGGGSRHGGGGGAGGLLTNFGILPIKLDLQSYSISVGLGGSGAASGTNTEGSQGQNSSAFNLTAIGGGAGSSLGSFSSLKDGGSGGGARGNSNALGGIGTANQGQNGGAGVPQLVANFGLGGGGGGFSQSGQSGNQTQRGKGGDGFDASSFVGINIGDGGWFAGGGGGGGSVPTSDVGLSGRGGGGHGNRGSSDNATSGTNGTGGGGGGGGHSVDINFVGKSGGSGIVIVRYRGSQRAKGGTVTTFNGWTIHTFLQSGNFEVGGFIGDISGNTNHGELVNGPTFNSNNLGSLVFDGINDTVDITTLDLRQNFTYECFVNHNVVSGFSFLGQGIFSTSNGLHIWFRNATDLRFGMYSNDTDANSLTTDVGVWYQYCFTYDHSTFLKQIYRNGVQLVGTPVETQNSYLGTGTVRIGATYSSGGAYASGKFSLVKIYSKVLTPQEIRQNFYATRGRYGV